MEKRVTMKFGYHVTSQYMCITYQFKGPAYTHHVHMDCTMYTS